MMKKGGSRQGLGLHERRSAAIHSRRRDSRGIALVEFAIIAPTLFLLVFGSIDFGRVYALQTRVKNMARAGAMWAQFNSAQFDTNGSDGCTNPYNLVYQALNEPNPPASIASYTVVLTDGTTTYTATGTDTSQCAASTPFPAGDQVTVRVTATFQFVTPLASVFMGSQSTTVTGTHTVVVQG
jgi:Flp pilus assembly protein TadG